MEDQTAKSIKNTLEVEKLLELLTGCVVDATKDGKISWHDITSLKPLITQGEMVVEAIEGAHLIKDELKDLSKEELMEIIENFLPICDNVIKVVKNLKK